MSRSCVSRGRSNAAPLQLLVYRWSAIMRGLFIREDRGLRDGERDAREVLEWHRHPRGFPALLRRQGAPAGAELVAGAARGRYPAVYECGDEPVQGCVPRPRETRLHAGDDSTE